MLVVLFWDVSLKSGFYFLGFLFGSPVFLKNFGAGGHGL